MTTVEVLRQAREFLTDRSHWFQEGSHGDRERNCVCAIGAIYLVVNGWGPSTPRLRASDQSNQAIAALAHQTSPLHVHVFNDRPETTHADVLAAFDRAIAAEAGHDG